MRRPNALEREAMTLYQSVLDVAVATEHCRDEPATILAAAWIRDQASRYPANGRYSNILRTIANLLHEETTTDDVEEQRSTRARRRHSRR